MLCECDNCGHRCDASALRSLDQPDLIADFSQRVAPREPMPAGECPLCGALAHPVTED